MVERPATSASEFIGVGVFVLVMGASLAAVILLRGSDGLAWLGWAVAGISGLAGQILVLIGVIGKGVQVGRRT